MSKLEHKKIEGVVINYPISSASALHNIRKALEILKNKKSIPLYYIYAEEEIHKGNRDVIIPLLKSIKYAYKNAATYKYAKMPQTASNKKIYPGKNDDNSREIINMPMSRRK